MAYLYEIMSVMVFSTRGDDSRDARAPKIDAGEDWVHERRE